MNVCIKIIWEIFLIIGVKCDPYISDDLWLYKTRLETLFKNGHFNLEYAGEIITGSEKIPQNEVIVRHKTQYCIIRREFIEVLRSSLSVDSGDTFSKFCSNPEHHSSILYDVKILKNYYIIYNGVMLNKSFLITNETLKRFGTFALDINPDRKYVFIPTGDLDITYYNTRPNFELEFNPYKSNISNISITNSKNDIFEVDCEEEYTAFKYINIPFMNSSVGYIKTDIVEKPVNIIKPGKPTITKLCSNIPGNSVKINSTLSISLDEDLLTINNINIDTWISIPWLMGTYIYYSPGPGIFYEFNPQIPLKIDKYGHTSRYLSGWIVTSMLTDENIKQLSPHGQIQNIPLWYLNNPENKHIIKNIALDQIKEMQPLQIETLSKLDYLKPNQDIYLHLIEKKQGLDVFNKIMEFYRENPDLIDGQANELDTDLTEPVDPSKQDPLENIELKKIDFRPSEDKKLNTTDNHMGIPDIDSLDEILQNPTDSKTINELGLDINGTNGQKISQISPGDDILNNDDLQKTIHLESIAHTRDLSLVPEINNNQNIIKKAEQEEISIEPFFEVSTIVDSGKNDTGINKNGTIEVLESYIESKKNPEIFGISSIVKVHKSPDNETSTGLSLDIKSPEFHKVPEVDESAINVLNNTVTETPQEISIEPLLEISTVIDSGKNDTEINKKNGTIEVLEPYIESKKNPEISDISPIIELHGSPDNEASTRLSLDIKSSEFHEAPEVDESDSTVLNNTVNEPAQPTEQNIKTEIPQGKDESDSTALNNTVNEPAQPTEQNIKTEIPQGNDEMNLERNSETKINGSSTQTLIEDPGKSLVHLKNILDKTDSDSFNIERPAILNSDTQYSKKESTSEDNLFGVNWVTGVLVSCALVLILVLIATTGYFCIRKNTKKSVHAENW